MHLCLQYCCLFPLQGQLQLYDMIGLIIAVTNTGNLISFSHQESCLFQVALFRHEKAVFPKLPFFVTLSSVENLI